MSRRRSPRGTTTLSVKPVTPPTLARVTTKAALAALAAMATAAIGLTAPTTTVSAQPSSATAQVGPVRYTEASGAQTPVWGASFLVFGNAFAQRVISSDDTVVLTLTGASSGSSAMWLSRTNRVFPAGGPLADDTVSLLNPSTPPATIGSGSTFTLLRTASGDDTILQTYVAVNAPGIYAGDVYIYDGTQPTMSSSTVVQHTTFSFTTAGAPRTMTVAPQQWFLVASPSDNQRTKVQLFDDSGVPTQPSTADTILIESSAPTVVSPSASSLTAVSFDDSLATPMGSAPLTINGGSVAGTATVSFTPQGTLPSSGVQPTSVTVTTRPLSATNPGYFQVAEPLQQWLFDAEASTEDTAVYLLNRQLITGLRLGAKGADPNSGVIGYATTDDSGWTGLTASGGPGTPTVSIADGATNVPIVMVSGSSGLVPLNLGWTGVDSGGSLTIRTGTGSTTKWTVIIVEDPILTPKTSPSGRIISKSGVATGVIVTLIDSFGNPFPGFKVAARSRAALGLPASAPTPWATTDTNGQATLSVPPPDDSYAGTAFISFLVTLPSGTPYAPLTPDEIRVTYSPTGAATSLTVAQAQTIPTTVSSTTTITALPYIVVPFTGTASTSAGNPGVWTPATASGTPAGTMATFTPTSVPAAQVQVSAPDGVWLSTTTSSGWNSGQTEVYVDSGSPVYAFSTKPGTYFIAFTVGGLTTQAPIKVATVPAAAYTVQFVDDSIQLTAGAFSTTSVRVLDPFGNPVPRTTDDTGGLEARITGEVLFGGMQPTARALTDDSGIATLSLVAAKSPGTGKITLAPSSGTKTPAWQPGYTVPAGFPDPKPTAEIPVTVGNTPAPKPQTLSITGTRGTVRGKSGITVTGTATGFSPLPSLSPWLRFPGETAFTMGSAVITPDSSGKFTWSRQTGKKVTVYVATADGGTRSNRVTID